MHAKRLASSILHLNSINQLQKACAFIDARIEKDPELDWLPHADVLLSKQVDYILFQRLRSVIRAAGLVNVFSAAHVRYSKRVGGPLTFTFTKDRMPRKIQVEVTRKYSRVVYALGDLDTPLRRTVLGACAKMSLTLFRRERMYRAVVQSEAELRPQFQPEMWFRVK